MKTKTYEVEVVRTSRVMVTLPETMCTDEFIEDWERSLWDLWDREDNIAEYAARIAVEYPEGIHDGVGRIITSSWEKPNYAKNKFQVVAIVDEDETETEVISHEDWKEVQA